MTEKDSVAVIDHDSVAVIDHDPVTYETGWDSAAGVSATLLNGMPYAWWLFIGGSFEILFGGMYLGSLQENKITAFSTQWFDLFYVIMGVWMVTLGFGILRQERWVWWGGWVTSLALGAVSVLELVRWVQGTPIHVSIVIFAVLNVLFVAYNVYFLLQPETRKVLHFAPFRGSPFSPGMALCGIALAVPSLAVTLVVNHIDRNLSDPVLLLVYFLGSVLVIVMAFRGLRMRRWVWWGDLAWAAILTGLSIFVIVDQLSHLSQGGSVIIRGLIFSGVNLIFVGIVVYLLLLQDIRAAVFGSPRAKALFSPRTLIGGLCLAVFALVIYLLPDVFGKAVVGYSVFGLAMGTIVGLLPGADPANRISGYLVGLLLALASYVARGGLLPYTNGSAAVVVLLMLLITTGITAVIRSRAWFVLMLLGVGTMYGLVEPAFESAPSAYLVSAGSAFVGILLGFGVGFAVSSLMQLELVPFKARLASPTTAGPSAATGTPAGDGMQTKAGAG